MSAALRPLVSAALACLVACTPPWPALEGCPDTAGCSTGDATTGGETPPTTAPDSGIQTVTGATDDTGSTSSGPGTDTTGAPDDGPPAILDVELTPDPIHFNGPIAVSVTAQHTDVVRMKLDTGAEVELEPVAPGVFGGEIAVYTGLDNGPHDATLTPTRELAQQVEKAVQTYGKALRWLNTACPSCTIAIAPLSCSTLPTAPEDRCSRSAPCASSAAPTFSIFSRDSRT